MAFQAAHETLLQIFFLIFEFESHVRLTYISRSETSSNQHCSFLFVGRYIYQVISIASIPKEDSVLEGATSSIGKRRARLYIGMEFIKLHMSPYNQVVFCPGACAFALSPQSYCGKAIDLVPQLLCPSLSLQPVSAAVLGWCPPCK